MINESLKNAFKEMWKKNLNLLDISKSDLESHISYEHPCYYAESYSIGGSARSAEKLDSSAGDSNTPVYFSKGKPVACTSLDLNTSGNAATASALKNSGMLDTQEKIDGFIAANAIKYATFKTTDSNNVNMASNDGMIISVPWTSSSYGAQLAFDDAQAATMKIRGYSGGWGDWKTLLNSSNYTDYTVKKDGTGASGTWGIGISGNAATASALTTSAGSATQPIYFSNGKPAACTYTLGKSVPSDAVFTDTVYTHPTTPGNKHIPSGGSSGQILRWSADGTAVWGADNNTTYSNVTTSTDGLMSSSDKTKLDGIAAGATKTTVDSALSSTSTNPVQNKVIYGAISSKADLDTSGKVLSSQLPSYVDDVLEYSAKSNFPSTGESGKIYVDTATNLTYRWSGSIYVEISQSLALGETSSTAYRGDRGKIAYDHSQTSHAPTNAEVNQNAFSNVKVGSTTVSADSKTDTLELVAGTNVTLTPDATNDKVTITTNDTKNTAGSTDTSSKIFLVGATSQAANPQTYSHDTAYVGSDGCLYSNNTKVSVEGHTHTVANISGLTATATELNYCDGVTSNIQTQLNNTVKLSGNQTIIGDITFEGVVRFSDPDVSIEPAIYTDVYDALKISVGGNLCWIDPDGHFGSSVDGRLIGANTLSTYGVTGIKGNAESSYRKGDVNITPANLGIPNARNITISTADPTSSDGGNGDVWIKYGSAQSNCPFPVGGVYISIVSTNPSSIWAGTTWEQFAKGKTLVGLDTSDSDFNTSGQTGGEKTHTLTTTEIPAHGHGMAHTHSYTGPNTASWKTGTNGTAHTWCTSAGSKTSGGASKTTTDNAGGGSAHNNLQPYIVVYMWKRVS